MTFSAVSENVERNRQSRHELFDSYLNSRDFKAVVST